MANVMDDFIKSSSRKWARLAKVCKVVPSDRSTATDTSEAYLFRLTGFDNVPVPKFLVDKSKSADNQIQVHLSATLYDTKGKDKDGNFLGNTWTGQRLLFKECSAKNDGKPVKWNGREAVLHTLTFGSDYGFVFHTKIKTEELRVITELVLTVCDKECKVRHEEYGICWGLLPLRSNDQSVTIDCKELDKHIITDAVYSGTPRLILFLGTNPTQLKKAKMDGALSRHFTIKHHKLKDVALQLMVENELCGGGDIGLGVIPGLEATEVENVSIPPGIVHFNCNELKIAAQITVIFEHSNFRIASDLEGQLKSYIAENSGQAKTVGTMSLVAEVGVHNGRRFIGKTPEEKFLGKSVQLINLEKTAGDGLWKADRITVSGCITSPLIAIVILLHAKLGVDPDDPQICLGWIPLLPWDDTGSVIEGEFKAELKLDLPAMSVSNCLLFRDWKGQNPIITTTVRLGAAQSHKTVTLADALVKQVEKESAKSFSPSQEGKVEDHKDGDSSSEAESVIYEEEPALPIPNRQKSDELPKVPTTADEESDGKGGELESFSLVCTTKGLGNSPTTHRINDLSMEITFELLAAKLQAEFKQRVCFEYVLPEGQEGAGSTMRVDDADTFDDLLDLLDEDAAGPNKLNGIMRVEVLPWPTTDKLASGEPQAPAQHGNVPSAGQVPPGKGGASEPSTGRLEHIELDCDTSEMGGSESIKVQVPIDWNWAKAKELLKEELGESVMLSYDDIYGESIDIDGDAAWLALIKEVRDDWAGDCDLDGGMDVKVHRVSSTVPARPAQPQPSLAPSTAGVTPEPVHPVQHNQPAAPAPAPPPYSASTAPPYSASSTAPSSHQTVDFQGQAAAANIQNIKQADGSGTVHPAAAGSVVRPSTGGKDARSSISREKEAATTIAKVVDSRSYNSDRDESDSLPDENYPPANRYRSSGGTPKPGGTERRIGKMLSTDSSDMEDKRRKDRGWGGGADVGARGRQGRHIQVEQEPDGAPRDEDMHILPGRPEPPAAMSRALKSKLFETSLSALVPGYHREVPSVEGSSGHLAGIQAEREVGGHEDIVVQIVAARIPSLHSRVYFTLQFYHFPVVETAVAALDKIPAQELPGEDESSCPSRLRLVDQAQRADGSGIVIKFAVDSSLKEGGRQQQPHPFARYMAARTLCIDVWDADSLLPVGTAQVDLRWLLRQGREAVQTTGEYTLTDPVNFSLFQDHRNASGPTPHVLMPRAASPLLPSSLFIRLVNLGKPTSTIQSEDGSNQAFQYKGRILPLTDSHAAFLSSAQGHVQQGLTRALALLFVHLEEVRRQVGNVDGPVQAERLQQGIIQSKLGLELTLREITSLTLHLTPITDGVRAPADLSRLRLGGNEDVGRSSDDRTVVMGALRAVLHWVAAQYEGDVGRALALHAAKETVSGAQVLQLLKEAQDGGIEVPAQAGDVLVRVLGIPLGSSVPLSQLVRFFTVEYVDAPAVAALGGAITVDKKTARWQRVRAARRQERGGRGDVPVEEEKVLLMEAAKKMREVHKESKIKEFLQKSITSRQVIMPSFGQTCYIPYVLRSPFSDERNISIHINDAEGVRETELELVTSTEEWLELQRQAGGPVAVVEEKMFSREGSGYTVWLAAHQAITVPFKFRSMSPALVHADTDALHGHCAPAPLSPAQAAAVATAARKIIVTFASRGAGGGKGPPLYVLEIQVRPRPFVVDHVFRMYQGQKDLLRRKILLDTAGDMGGCSWRGGVERGGGSVQGQMKHVWCSNPAVVVACTASSAEPQRLEIQVKCRCGVEGSEEAFYLVLYNDPHHVSLYEIWLVRIRVVERSDIEGLVGQTQGGHLVLRLRNYPRTVVAYASHPHDITLPDRPRHVDAPLADIPYHFHPLVPGRRDVLVHIVEPPTPGLAPNAMGGAAEPVKAYLVATRARLPFISKQYNIQLPLGKVCNKKILYTNPYRERRVFKLKTDQPGLVSFKDPSATLSIPHGGQHYIGLRFGAQERGGRWEVLVFINDEEERNEECLAIHATYA